MSDYAEESRRAGRWTWVGLGLAALAVILMLAFAFGSGTQTTGDGVGTDDAGVVHPQPVGVDDDDVAGD